MFLQLFSLIGRQFVHFLADLTHLHPEQVPVLLHLQQDMISLKLSRGLYSLKNQAKYIAIAMPVSTP